MKAFRTHSGSYINEAFVRKLFIINDHDLWRVCIEDDKGNTYTVGIFGSKDEAEDELSIVTYDHAD